MTVNPLKGIETPAPVVTVKVLNPGAALAAIVMVIGKLVAVPPDPIAAVTPVPLKVTAVAPLSLEPPSVVDSVGAPTEPDDGVIPETTGPGGVIVKGRLDEGLAAGAGLTTRTCTVRGVETRPAGTVACNAPAFWNVVASGTTLVASGSHWTVAP